MPGMTAPGDQARPGMTQAQIKRLNQPPEDPSDWIGQYRIGGDGEAYVGIKGPKGAYWRRQDPKFRPRPKGPQMSP